MINGANGPSFQLISCVCFMLLLTLLKCYCLPACSVWSVGGFCWRKNIWILNWWPTFSTGKIFWCSVCLKEHMTQNLPADSFPCRNVANKWWRLAEWRWGGGWGAREDNGGLHACVWGLGWVPFWSGQTWCLHRCVGPKCTPLVILAGLLKGSLLVLNRQSCGARHNSVKRIRSNIYPLWVEGGRGGFGPSVNGKVWSRKLF